MTDDLQPPPVFPQYQPPDPNGPLFAHPKQAKPLFKMIKRLMNPRPKPRPMKMKNRSSKRKRDAV